MASEQGDSDGAVTFGGRNGSTEICLLVGSGAGAACVAAWHPGAPSDDAA